MRLNILLILYKSLVKEIKTLEAKITLIEKVHPHYMSVPGIVPISSTVIYSEYNDVSNFSAPAQMLAFAGIEPSINESGTELQNGRMVKHGSSQLRYVFINCYLPLIRFSMTYSQFIYKKTHGKQTSQSSYHSRCKEKLSELSMHLRSKEQILMLRNLGDFFH